jgi:hypothetical protein
MCGPTSSTQPKAWYTERLSRALCTLMRHWWDVHDTPWAVSFFWPQHLSLANWQEQHIQRFQCLPGIDTQCVSMLCDIYGDTSTDTRRATGAPYVWKTWGMTGCQFAFSPQANDKLANLKLSKGRARAYQVWRENLRNQGHLLWASSPCHAEVKPRDGTCKRGRRV